MTDDDGEIIPPHKGLLATRTEKAPSPVSDVRRTDTGGVVRTALTGWQARAQGRALESIAKRIRSETDLIKAQGELADEYETTARKVNRLRHLPDNIALDDEKWKGEREEERAEITHRKEMNRRRREREIEEANAKLVEAKRGTFNASQGLENQERLKQLNMEVWEKRAGTEKMDAEKIWLLLRREVDSMKSPQQKPADGSLEQLAEMRASLMQRAQEAAASGDAGKADQYERLAAELDELVVAALRGQTQK